MVWLCLLGQAWGSSIAIPFKPVVEGDVPGALLPRHPKHLFAERPNNDVPYMASVCSDEGSFFSIGRKIF